MSHPERFNLRLIHRNCLAAAGLDSDRTRPLGSLLKQLMRRRVEPRRRRYCQIAEAWSELLPRAICEHTCLHSLRNGTLTIRVDDANILYELQLMLQEGLVEHLRRLCPAVGLVRIRLQVGAPDAVPGRKARKSC